MFNHVRWGALSETAISDNPIHDTTVRRRGYDNIVYNRSCGAKNGTLQTRAQIIFQTKTFAEGKKKKTYKTKQIVIVHTRKSKVYIFVC